MAGETNSGIYKIDGVRIIAASAQRAEADGNGDVISTTYLKKADSSATEWNSVYDTVEANSGNWDNVSAKLDSATFTAFTANADVTPYTAGDYITIDGHTINGEDWTDEIAAATSAAEEDAVKEVESKFNHTVDGITGWNNSAFAGTKYTAGDGIGIDASNVISVTSDFVTSAGDALSGKQLVLRNNAWVELNETGAFEVAELDEQTGEPVVDNPSHKIIYLTKDDEAQITDPYTEWIYTESNVWEIIGETSMPLENYVTTAEAQDWDVTEYSAGANINITNHVVSGKDWTSTIQDASANAVTTVAGNFETLSGEITGYAGTAFATPAMSANEWNSVYNTVEANSANWTDTYTIINVPGLDGVPDITNP